MNFYGGINIKTYQKIFIFLGILILILLSYFVVFPFLLVGSPTSLFYISNEDLQSHEVTVEVFDPHKESIFRETYELAPEEQIWQPKPMWLIFRWLMPWSERGAEGKYEFKVILDGKTTDTCRTLPHPWSSVTIDINKTNNSDSPMRIGVITV